MLEGEGANTPAKTHQHINLGVPVSCDFMYNVPIVTAAALPRVPPSLKEEVLAGSGWEGTPEEELSNAESSEVEEVERAASTS